MASGRRPVAVLGLALAVLTAACGGDDTGGAAATSTSTTPTSAAEVTSTTSAASSTTAAAAASTTAPATTSTGKATTTRKATTTAKATTTTTTPRPTTTAAASGDLAAVHLKLTRVASASQPLALALRPGHAPMYLAQKSGEVRLWKDGVLEAAPVLDISGQVSTGGEQGLLGLAFSPDGDRLYVSYTDTGGDERVDEYGFGAGDRAIAVASKRNVVTIADPASNHNGGNILFGPDGYLWWGLGDGGGAGDQFHNAQDPNQLLGKVLRIDPRASGGTAYRPAPDNPYASGRGGGRPEIAITGMRNPWRFSFDRGTGDLWIGDVGQDRYEEIDRLRAGTALGKNLGWPYREGAHPFDGRTPPAGLVDPVFDYGRDGGAAVAGGYVYRGSAIPALRGVYVFADTYNAELRLLSTGTGPIQHRATGVAVPGGLVSSFGEGPGGELYALSLNGGVYRIDGA